MPILMNISLLFGSRYSLLSIRTIALRAPSCLANTAEIMLIDSSGRTAINRSALRTAAFFNTAKVVQSPSMVITSAIPATSSIRLGSSSITVMSWEAPLNIFAKWLPTSPTPEITILMGSIFRLYPSALALCLRSSFPKQILSIKSY